MAEDYIQKGVLILQHQNGKCRLKKANDVSRVILAAARGWQSRSIELKNALQAARIVPPFDKLKPECNTMIDDYIDHMVIVSCLLNVNKYEFRFITIEVYKASILHELLMHWLF